jgi:hypothetical protein
MYMVPSREDLKGLLLVSAGTLGPDDFEKVGKPGTEIFTKDRVSWVRGIESAHQVEGSL